MKIIDTLSDEEIVRVCNGDIVGFFQFLFDENDEYISYAQPLCTGYYLGHSGYKTVAPIYETLIENSANSEILIANIIKNKFKDKWNRVYKSLISDVYNVLDNYEGSETRNSSGDNTTTYDTNVENDINSETKEKVTRGYIAQDNVFGFNSIASVGSSDGSVTEEVITETNPDENKTHNEQKKTGNDKKEFGYNDTRTKHGRDVSGSKLITEELKLRNSQNFFDIVYTDIDSIITLAIYNRR